MLPFASLYPTTFLLTRVADDCLDSGSRAALVPSSRRRSPGCPSRQAFPRGGRCHCLCPGGLPKGPADLCRAGRRCGLPGRTPWKFPPACHKDKPAGAARCPGRPKTAAEDPTRPRCRGLVRPAGPRRRARGGEKTEEKTERKKRRSPAEARVPREGLQRARLSERQQTKRKPHTTGSPPQKPEGLPKGSGVPSSNTRSLGV